MLISRDYPRRHGSSGRLDDRFGLAFRGYFDVGRFHAVADPEADDDERETITEALRYQRP